jgi:hypothetical protein
MTWLLFFALQLVLIVVLCVAIARRGRDKDDEPPMFV